MADERPKVVIIPDDFSYLDPDRPEVMYESDLSDDERQRLAPGLAAMHKRAASGVRLGPPWTIKLEDGSSFTIPAPSPNGDQSDVREADRG